MKKIIFTLFFLSVVLAGFSQVRGKAKVLAAGGKAIDAAQVPEAVKNSFSSAFPSATAVRWEKHGAVTQKRTYVKFVAVYTHEELRCRARYKEDGTALSSSKYFGPNKTPEAIKTAVTSRFSGFTVTGSEEITTKDGKVFYRTRLRKGASKVITYTDAEGNEVKKDKAPQEVTDGEEEDEG